MKTKTRELISTDLHSACMLQAASVLLVFINLATEVVTHNVAGCFHFNKIQAHVPEHVAGKLVVMQTGLQRTEFNLFSM